jgi:hypothetical protein
MIPAPSRQLEPQEADDGVTTGVQFRYGTVIGGLLKTWLGTSARLRLFASLLIYPPRRFWRLARGAGLRPRRTVQSSGLVWAFFQIDSRPYKFCTGSFLPTLDLSPRDAQGHPPAPSQSGLPYTYPTPIPLAAAAFPGSPFEVRSRIYRNGKNKSEAPTHT